MKIYSRPKNKKTDFKNLCPYCYRPHHVKKKCHHNYGKITSQNIKESFKNSIKELKKKADTTKRNTEVDFKKITEPYSSIN